MCVLAVKPILIYKWTNKKYIFSITDKMVYIVVSDFPDVCTKFFIFSAYHCIYNNICKKSWFIKLFKLKNTVFFEPRNLTNNRSIVTPKIIVSSHKTSLNTRSRASCFSLWISGSTYSLKPSSITSIDKVLALSIKLPGTGSCPLFKWLGSSLSKNYQYSIRKPQKSHRTRF